MTVRASLDPDLVDLAIRTGIHADTLARYRPGTGPA